MAPVPCVRCDSGWNWDYNLGKRRPDLRARRCRRCGKRRQQSSLAEDVKNIYAVSNRWLPLEMRLGMAVQNLGKGRRRVARFNACVN
ncbi:unnamed protein product [Sphagnum troendelagicum]